MKRIRIYPFALFVIAALCSAANLLMFLRPGQSAMYAVFVPVWYALAVYWYCEAAK